MRTLFFVSFMGLVVGCGSATVNNNGGDGGSSNGDGSTMPGSDGGGNPNGGPITFPAQCPAFTACGGNLVGTWDYSDGCVADPFKDFKSACPALTVMDEKGTVKGSVTFTDKTVKRAGSVAYSATIVLPPSCVQGVPCSTFNMKGATCTGSGTCNCQVTGSDSIVDEDTYTVQGSKVVTGGGNEYDYCVMGSKLQYTETGANAQHVGVFDLAKR
jgi:hypothetical protein